MPETSTIIQTISAAKTTASTPMAACTAFDIFLFYLIFFTVSNRLELYIAEPFPKILRFIIAHSCSVFNTKKGPTFVHQTAKGRTAVYFTRRTGRTYFQKRFSS